MTYEEFKKKQYDDLPDSLKESIDDEMAKEHITGEQIKMAYERISYSDVIALIKDIREDGRINRETGEYYDLQDRAEEKDATMDVKFAADEAREKLIDEQMTRIADAIVSIERSRRIIRRLEHDELVAHGRSI